MDDDEDLLGTIDAGQHNLQLALRLAAQGFPVFPCREKAETVRRKVRNSDEYQDRLYKEKSPYIINGFKGATTDVKTIKRWWNDHPRALVGLPTGEQTGFAVVDLDRHEGKANGVLALSKLGFEPADLTNLIVTTAGNGLHLYFKWKDGISNKDKHLPGGIDVRAQGGYVIAPGTVFPDGRKYSSGDLKAIVPDFPDTLMPPPEHMLAHGESGDKFRADYSVEEIREWASELPNPPEMERVEWFNFIAAFHHEATAPNEHGELRPKSEVKAIRQIALDWTAKNPSYGTEEHLRTAGTDFDSLGKRPLARVITFRTVTSVVRSLREDAALENEFDDLGEPETDDSDDLLGTETTADEVKEEKARVEKTKRWNDWDDRDAPKYIRKMNRDHAILRFNSKTYIVDLVHEKSDELVSMGDEKGLHLAYADKLVEMTFLDKDTGKTKHKEFSWSQRWLKHPSRRYYPKGMCFNPKKDEPGKMNLWRGWNVEEDPNGRCDLLIKHIENVLCSGVKAHADAFLDFMAHIVQRPWERPTFSIVMRGAMGAGKDTPFTYLGMMLPAHYITVGRNSDISGRFNGHLMGKIVVHLQEGFFAGNREQQSYMKFLLSSTKINIERKGVDIFSTVALHRTIISSNEDWVAPASWGERRYFVLDVANTYANGVTDESSARNKAHFDAIETQMLKQGGLGKFFYILKNRDISKFDIRRPPRTEALARQVLEGLNGIDRWWYDVLETGCIDSTGSAETAMRTVWERDWITRPSDNLFNSYERWRAGKRFRAEPISRAKFAREMRRLCPRLLNKQLRLDTDVDRTRAYVMPNLKQCRNDFEGLVGGGLDWDAIILEDEEDDL